MYRGVDHRDEARFRFLMTSAAADEGVRKPDRDTAIINVGIARIDRVSGALTPIPLCGSIPSRVNKRCCVSIQCLIAFRARSIVNSRVVPPASSVLRRDPSGGHERAATRKWPDQYERLKD